MFKEGEFSFNVAIKQKTRQDRVAFSSRSSKVAAESLLKTFINQNSTIVVKDGLILPVNVKLGDI